MICEASPNISRCHITLVCDKRSRVESLTYWCIFFIIIYCIICKHKLPNKWRMTKLKNKIVLSNWVNCGHSIDPSEKQIDLSQFRWSFKSSNEFNLLLQILKSSIFYGGMQVDITTFKISLSCFILKKHLYIILGVGSGSNSCVFL